jgi:hypothetical protein
MVIVPFPSILVYLKEEVPLEGFRFIKTRELRILVVKYLQYNDFYLFGGRRFVGGLPLQVNQENFHPCQTKVKQNLFSHSFLRVGNKGIFKHGRQQLTIWRMPFRYFSFF